MIFAKPRNAFASTGTPAWKNCAPRFKAQPARQAVRTARCVCIHTCVHVSLALGLNRISRAWGGSMEVCNQRRGRRVLPIDNARALSSGLVHPSVVKTCGLCSLELRNAASGSFVVWGCRTWCWCSMRATGTGSLFTWVPIASMLTLVRYV